MCRHSPNYTWVPFSKTLRNANFRFVAIRPTAHQMCIIEKCIYFYSIHVCLCACVRALLIVKLFAEVKCVRTLKLTVATMINSMGKIIQTEKLNKNLYGKLYARSNVLVSKFALPVGLGLELSEQRVTQNK